MSSPFGGHPNFGQYLAWVESVGCNVQHGVAPGLDGRPYSVTRIISPDGQRWLNVVGKQHADFLVPTDINYFDRRLGLTSPFVSFPHPGLGT